jgi:hypothetical protein
VRGTYAKYANSRIHVTLVALVKYSNGATRLENGGLATEVHLIVFEPTLIYRLDVIAAAANGRRPFEKFLSGFAYVSPQF